MAVQFRVIWACLSQDINEFDSKAVYKTDFFKSGKRWGGGMKRIFNPVPKENFLFEINL